jgi:hypothetical protein
MQVHVVKVMQNPTKTPSLQKRMISYMQTGQFSPSNADIKGAPQLPVLNAKRPFFKKKITVTVMFI